MLFNTLAYAQFFAIVFVTAWLLVDRRMALLLPWMALAGMTVARLLPWQGLAIEMLTPVATVVIAFGLTLALLRQAPGPKGDEPAPPPPPHLALVSLFVSGIALAFFTYRAEGIDPFSYALAALGVPIQRLGPLTWLVGIMGTVVFYLLLVARKVRLLFILGASYVFYAHWDWRFLPLIWGSSTIDWWLGRKIHAATDDRTRKLWLVGTVIVNLGVLGFFKYFNFGIDSASALLAQAGITVPEMALRVALPVGISFFTFESMSYVIDVYRRELEPQKSYFEYLSFVAFFPHLVAGPIVRPRDLLPQLAGPARWNSLEASEGLFLVGLGLAKKIVVGDYLALNLIDRVFDAPLMYSALENYAAVVGYALQIYCDFSGYTDIAIGSALLLGVRFPLNFDSPYKSASIVEFWRRWHISLSTWLRDYLYIPLGGNRIGPRRTYLNLLITMVLGGLWHGAAWTFVVWGTLHGLALAVNKWWFDFKKRPRDYVPHGWSKVLAVGLTFHFVLVCWVFFRAPTFDRAWLVFSQIGTLTTHHPNLPPKVLGILVLGLVTHFVPDRVFAWLQQSFVRLPGVVQGVLLFLLAMLLRRMASADAVPFVYFQF